MGEQVMARVDLEGTNRWPCHRLFSTLFCGSIALANPLSLMVIAMKG